MKPDALIPSMFHRRLLLLIALVMLGMLLLIGRLFQLTLLQGAELREDAEKVLVAQHLLPTFRGSIVDRHGLSLAVNRPCFDIMVDYRFISDEWATAQAEREARSAHAERWSELRREDRAALIEQYKPRYRRVVDQMWADLATAGGVPVADVMATRVQIHDRVEKMALDIWERWRVARETQYQLDVAIEDVKRPIAEQREPHPILSGIAAAREGDFRRLAQRSPKLRSGAAAISLRAAGKRVYPWTSTDVVLDRSSLPSPLRSDVPVVIHVDHLMENILGKMRNKVYEEDVKARPIRDERGRISDLGGYIHGDSVGARGLERAFENALRGQRGMIIQRLDTGDEQRTDHVPGQDIQIAIDVKLQARITAVLSPEFGLTVVQPWQGGENGLPNGTPLDATSVVIDVSSGDILAMASSPIVLNDGMTYEDIPATELVLHRALQRPYPPGSIVKPLMLCAAVSEGVWPLDHEVACNGHYYTDDPDHFRCWIYRPPQRVLTHGPLSAVGAIGRSCNIYFYTIGDTIGAEGLLRWYRQWGIQQPIDPGISIYNGILPADADRIARNETLMMGIGQGPVAWTPLHAANAFATLARGGYFMEPLLVQDDPRPDRTRLEYDLGLSDDVVRTAIEGIDAVVNNQVFGGARQIDINPPNNDTEPIFNVEGVRVMGKTGTAQQQWPRARDVSDDADETKPTPPPPHRFAAFPAPPRGIGTHSWFVGLARPDGDPDGPTYAVAVMVEWGGSGSRCAAVVANQIIHALQDEGYL